MLVIQKRKGLLETTHKDHANSQVDVVARMQGLLEVAERAEFGKSFLAITVVPHFV